MKRSMILVMLVAATSACDNDGPSAAKTRRQTSEKPRVVVDLATVAEREVTSTLELVGNLLPRRRTLVVTEVDGVIESIAVSKRRVEVEAGGRRVSREMRLGMGEAVKTGDVLAQLVKRDFELAMAVAQARLVKARADLAAIEAWKRPEEVRGLEAVVRQGAARLEETRKEVERVTKMRAKSAGTQSEVDRARAAFLIAKAVHAAAAAKLALAKAGPREADLAVARASIASALAEVEVQKERLAKTTIKAPYDGVITDVFVDVGDRVTAQPRIEVLELMDLSVMAAEVGMPERYTGQIKFGDRVTVLCDGMAKPVLGVVIRVNDKIKTATRTFQVRCGIDNRDGRFKAGQFARVRFRFSSATRRLAIPVAALTFQGGEPSVFVLEGGRVSLQRIGRGLSDGQFVEVLTGLTAGQKVVTHDPALLASGMAVEVGATSEGEGR